MSTKVFHRNGGYTVVPSRWIDGGYMAAAPGSVTQVYLVLCRWANNTTLEANQSVSQISKATGLAERIVRQALRTLEAWDALECKPQAGPRGTNVWILNELQDVAPPYPGKHQPLPQSDPPAESDPRHKVTPLQKVEGVPPSQSGTHSNAKKKSKTRSSNELLVEPLERGSSESSGSTTTSGSSEASPPPHVAIMKAWLDCIGVAEYPPRGDKLWNMARNAAKGGLVPDEVRPIYEWLIRNDSNGFWKARGIDPINLLNNRGKWISVGRPGLERMRVVPGSESGLEAELAAIYRQQWYGSWGEVERIQAVLEVRKKYNSEPTEAEKHQAWRAFRNGHINIDDYPWNLTPMEEAS